MKIILVPGTHAWDGHTAGWYSPGSLFVDYLHSIGVELLDAARPFVWSTRLGGLGLGDGDLLNWKASGVNLFAYVVPPRCPHLQVPSSETVILSHSHGLQPVLFAAADGLKIDTFIDVAGPVRADMMHVARAARPNIRRWVHVHAGRRDLWQWFGELGDGACGVVRKHPEAHDNIAVNTADHNDVLELPQYFPIIGKVLQS